MFGKKTSLVVVLILGIAAIAAILHLQAGATQSTKAQLLLSEVKVELNALQSTPFRANPKTGGSPVVARKREAAGETWKSKPKTIDTCHAYASDGPVVKRLWPEFYTGS